MPINSSIDGKTRIYGLIGNPVAHSLSPQFQNAAFAACGINAVYLPFPLEKITPECKNAFSLCGIKGFNVTVPFKRDIIALLDHIDTAAAKIGSVNTVVLENQKWIGYSTDGVGFIKGLQADGFAPEGKTVQVIGAGGAAAAVCDALLAAGVSEMTIANRTQAKALAFADQLSRRYPVPIKAGFAETNVDLLVNTSSVGMMADELPCPPEVIKRAGFVSDIIYRTTALIKAAAMLGTPCQTGRNMLLYQGATAFELWTKHPAPIMAMRAALM